MGWFTANNLIAVATFVYALVTIVMVFAICKQAEYMRRGLRISIKAARASKQAADAAKQGANAAESAASTAARTLKDNQAAFAQTLGQMQVQTGAQQMSADAARKSAETLINGERPWVGIDLEHAPTVESVSLVLKRTTADGPPEVGAIKARVSFTIKNFENSPAIKIAPFEFHGITTAEPRVPEQVNRTLWNTSEQRCKSPMAALTLMPKTLIRRTTDEIVNFTGSALLRSTLEEPIDPDKSYVAHIWLGCCIAYRDTLSPQIHHTRVVLHSDYVPETPSKFSFWESDAD